MQILKRPSDRPYALSMRAIRAATRILPAHVLQRVERLLVLDHPVGPERFEYDAQTKQAQFACLGDANDADARAHALRDLLLGLARVDAEAPFGIQLGDADRKAFDSFVDRWYPRCAEIVANLAPREPRPERRLMYIEYKGDGIVGPARIGWVTFSKSGKTVNYRGHRFASLAGHGFKANYFDEDTGDHYWISGCKKDGSDALYSTTIEIDDDAREEYWVNIRGLPERKHQAKLRSVGRNR